MNAYELSEEMLGALAALANAELDEAETLRVEGEHLWRRSRRRSARLYGGEKHRRASHALHMALKRLQQIQGQHMSDAA